MSDTAAMRAIRLLRDRRPQAWALARAASLATQVDPSLLRRLRLEFVPDADAGAEADLSLSDLVRFRGADGLVFYDDAAAVLRAELASDRALLERAWTITEREHRHLPLALRLEEELGYRLLGDDERSRQRIHVLLRAAVAALVTGADGLAHWAARALPRLPADLFEDYEEAQMLHAGALVRLDTPLDRAAGDGEALPKWLAWVAQLPSARTRIQVRISQAFPSPQTKAAVRRLEAGALTPSASDADLDLPATDPLVLEVIGTGAGASSHGSASERIAARLHFAPGAAAAALVPDGPLRLRTVLNEEYLLEPAGSVAARAAGEIIDFTLERERHRRDYVEEPILDTVLEAIVRIQTPPKPAGEWISVTGNAGSGKTALLANLVERLQGRVTFVAQHFFRSDVPAWASMDRALHSICAQIERRFPFTATGITGAVPARRLFSLLSRYAAHRAMSDTLVIVLDALEEARTNGEGPRDFFPRELPPGVIVVWSAASDNAAAESLERDRTFTLDDVDPKARGKAISRYLAKKELRGDTLIDTCAGNWRFASLLAAFITIRRDASLAGITPGNVETLIERLVRQMPEYIRLAIAVVAVAREPVPVHTVRRISEAARSKSARSRRSGRPIEEYDLLVPIRPPDGTAALALPASGFAQVFDVAARVSSAHRQILRDMRVPLGIEGFFRRQRLFHAAKAWESGFVRALTRDVAYLATRCAQDGIAELLEDLRLCEQEMPGVLDLRQPQLPKNEPPSERRSRTRKRPMPKHKRPARKR